MEGKPLHYDGSIQNNANEKNEFVDEPFKLTDEIRVNLSGNPYVRPEAE